MITKEERTSSMRKLNAKRRERILKATGNGRCWWLYQMLMHNSYNVKTSRK
jgi:hypothetical protein